MAVSITDYFKINKETFAATGAVDTILDVDSLYFLDPKSLKTTQVPEFVGSYSRLETNFENILKLLKKSDGKDIFWNEAWKLLPRGELKGLNLGYSIGGTDGSGFGPKHKLITLRTAKQIVDAGVEDPTFFELLGVFQKGIGSDRISDLVSLIIAEDIIKYSERVFRTVGVNQKRLFRGQLRDLPSSPFKPEPVLVLPQDLLRDLPVARDWSEVDTVCAQNEELRKEVNSIIGSTWKRAAKKDKDILKRALLTHPDLLKDLMRVYQSKEAKVYDFSRDPAGELSWYETTKRLVREYPLALDKTPQTPEELIKLVRTIALHFKQLVENNGQYELLYRDNACRHHKPERAAQKLFFAIADAYCKANDIDISPETHSGRGSVDFKLSRGYSMRVIVETKLSTSSALVHGYETQVEEYTKAEKIPLAQAFYLPILVTASPLDRLKVITQARSDMLAKKLSCPELIEINAQYKETASVLKPKSK